jgi:fructose-1,6-bisphosphatase/inositol monophosphatase family enzyme
MSKDGEAIDVCRVAELAAQAGADELLRMYGSETLDIRSKGEPSDIVTEADLASEEAVRKVIARARPNDGIVGEESSERRGFNEIRWFVDPLDSTANYARELPIWSVSVGCEDAHGVLAGAVCDPLRGEVICRGREWDVRSTRKLPPRGKLQGSLSEAMVVIGLGPDIQSRSHLIGALFGASGKVRSPGSPALGLAWTAIGRYDAAYYEMAYSRWDVCAGIALCEASGLLVSECHRKEAAYPCLLVALSYFNDEMKELLDL